MAKQRKFISAARSVRQRRHNAQKILGCVSPDTRARTTERRSHNRRNEISPVRQCKVVKNRRRLSIRRKGINRALGNLNKSNTIQQAIKNNTNVRLHQMSRADMTYVILLDHGRLLQSLEMYGLSLNII